MTVCGRWAGRDGRRGRSKRPSRTGMARVAGTFGCPMDGSDTGVAVRQEVESFRGCPRAVHRWIRAKSWRQVLPCIHEAIQRRIRDLVGYAIGRVRYGGASGHHDRLCK